MQLIKGHFYNMAFRPAMYGAEWYQRKEKQKYKEGCMEMQEMIEISTQGNLRVALLKEKIKE